MFYLVHINISRKQTLPLQGWKAVQKRFIIPTEGADTCLLTEIPFRQYRGTLQRNRNPASLRHD